VERGRGIKDERLAALDFLHLSLKDVFDIGTLELAPGTITLFKYQLTTAL